VIVRNSSNFYPSLTKLIRELQIFWKNVHQVTTVYVWYCDDAEATDALEVWRAQRRVYRDLLRRKRKGFWQSTVEAQRTNPQQLWKLFDTLLGRGRPPDQVEITAEEFQRFFEDKVAAVRSSTASAPKPDFVTGPPGVSWSVFDPVDYSKVANAIRQLPDKTCAADPVPTSVLKQLADDILPFLATLINRSLTEFFLWP